MKKYQTLEVEVIKFETNDVITTSGEPAVDLDSMADDIVW